MSLIDIDFNKEKNVEQENEILYCKKCKDEILQNSPILLCEKCFNENIKDTLNKVIENIWKINDNLKNIDKTLEKISSDLNNNNLHIVIQSKLEIDLLNFKSIKQKLLIDKKLNEDAFELNQIQANKLRKIMNWTQFDHMDIKDSLNAGDKNEEK